MGMERLIHCSTMDRKQLGIVQIGNGWSSQRLIYRLESKILLLRTVEVDID